MKCRNIKNIIGVFILTIMLTFPAQIQAVGSKGNPISGSQEFINKSIPKNARISSIETVQAPIYKASNGYSVYSLTDLKNIIKSNMNNRVTDFSVDYTGDTLNLKADINSIIGEISNEDDYLNYSYSRYGFGYNGYVNDVTISFSFEYFSTKAQEDFVDSKVNSILGQIINPSMTSDQKEKSIHDYIVKNVQYDTSLTRFSAYNALYEGKTVCNGYALLAYKMLKDVGIEARIVAGKGNNENHAWNLVKLNGKWYQLDCTWDDPVPDVKGRVLYDYYNVTDSQLELDHSWDHSQYPSATTVYVESTDQVVSSDGVNIDFTNYKKWNNSPNVAKSKIWSAKFTKPFDAATINTSNVLVYEQNGSLLYPVNNILITCNDTNDTIYVKPSNEYTVGKTYHLVITQKVLSKDGKAIPKPIVVSFTVTE